MSKSNQLTTAFVLILICSPIVVCQEKSIKSEEYLTKRPENVQPMGGTLSGPSSKPQPGPKKVSPKKPGPTRVQQARSNELVYVVDNKFPVGPAPSGNEFVRLGVTTWKLSATECQIPDCPMPVTSGTRGLMDTAASRIDDNSILSTGYRVRLGLESLSHSGFIYIIDREQFADGVGEAYLLFPTRSINNGNNWAVPGLQIQLPRANGCFCVKSRNAQRQLVADNLIVILSPVPLLDPSEIGVKEIALPSKLLSYVKRADQEQTYRGSLRGGEGLAPTQQEHQAGTKGLFDTAPVLTQADLPPQNIYQAVVPQKTPAVFSFALRYDSTFKKP